jgi:hypothetical protein
LKSLLVPVTVADERRRVDYLRCKGRSPLQGKPGDILVADLSAGSTECGGSGCGAGFRVDPVSGAITPIAQGQPFFDPRDVAVATSPTIVIPYWLWARRALAGEGLSDLDGTVRWAAATLLLLPVVHMATRLLLNALEAAGLRE